MVLDQSEESLALINDNFRAETLRSSLDHLNSEVILDCRLKYLKNGVQIIGGINITGLVLVWIAILNRKCLLVG